MRHLMATLALGTTVVASSLSLASPAVAAPITLSATSTFVAYEKASYAGRSVPISGCGVHRITYHGSYKWYANGQSGHLFNNSTGSGVPHTRLSSEDNASSRSGFGWGSILIVC
ncbi:MiAMP1 family antimicrobial peptide [Nonomuraea sp. NBC_01738]|uniref:MiAMP1 family antimicrobial peptide n=1 Tax=Nonomuraea sp. NBC_01738 TaxID=2976003 RepID=UPI002E11F7CE|nr:MiAMP1 family antimicrobial peptide [Nonomuraea sp. NBC_01738]WSG18808.1 MiAMP1 family antimicrobial peptide [Nonomuraea sp. NBC_01738]